MGLKKNRLLYFGHHKCATQWVNSILRHVCENAGLKFTSLHNAATFNNDLPKYLRENDLDVVAYINADYRHIRGLEDFKAFHVVRDPRDMWVSAYFSHLYSHPTKEWSALEEFREKLKKAPKNEGLLMDLEFLKTPFSHMSEWDYSNPNIMELRMEDLTAEPERVFPEVFKFLGLSERVPPEALSLAIRDNRFERKAGGRKAGQEDIKNHYRKGVAGDWINHLTVRHVNYFKAHYNDLLLKLGYEKEQDWDLDIPFMDQQLAEKTISEKDRQIAEKNKQIIQKDLQLTEKDRQLAEKNSRIMEMDRQIAEKDNQIKALRDSWSWRITAPLRKAADLSRSK